MTPGRLLYLTKRRWHLGVSHWIAQHFLEARIDHWRRAEGLMVAPVPVHVLTSKHDWRMALWMLASLHEFTQLHWPITLHEDGSLGNAELMVFERLFPGIRIIRRAEADPQLSKLLATRPRCANYRRKMPHGLKAFDIPHLAETPRFLLLDPDVLFFSQPTEILNWVWATNDRSCWFNQDFQEPSPITQELSRQAFGVDLWSRVNSGLCLLNRESVTDFDAMENWLEHPALQDLDVQWRVEQTLLALSASKAGRGGLLPMSYEVSAGKHRRPDCVSRHYVGCVRDRFLSEGVRRLASQLTPA